MSLSNISATVCATALALAVPVHAVDTAILPGSHGAPFFVPSEIISAADTDFEQAEEPVQQAEEPVEEQASEPSEPDWLTAPPDPDRHNLWVPTLEWTVALTLTIPLFMIDPAFVNTGTFSSGNFVDAWTKPPVWDTDGFVANYILHPIMGAEAYLSVRNRDYGPIPSFLFATAVSVGWEYLFEAWVERPSGQDLLVTSPIGSLQGELMFQIRRKVAKWDPSMGRDALLILIDPVEALHRYVNKEFLDDSKDPTNEKMGSSLNIGTDQARLMLTLQF